MAYRGQDVAPQGVRKASNVRHFVVGSLVVSVLVSTAVVGVASRGHSAVKKVAAPRILASDSYTPPVSVYTAPVFPPAPIVPTPAYTPVPTPVRVPAPVVTKAPVSAPVVTKAPVPVYVVAPVPVPTVDPVVAPGKKLGPEQLAFGSSTVITDGDSSAKLSVGTNRFYTSNDSSLMPMTPHYGLYEVVTVSFVGVTGKFDENEFSFYVRGADGVHYDGAFVVGFDPQLFATTLVPGEPVKGNLVFDVPDKTGILVYESGGEASKEWK